MKLKKSKKFQFSLKKAKKEKRVIIRNTKLFYTKGDRAMSKKMPNSVCWNITSRCNEKYKFCYRDRDSREVSFADKKKVIDRIAAAGIRKLTFAGGEPLLVENIRELILYAKSRGLMVSLTALGSSYISFSIKCS